MIRWLATVLLTLAAAGCSPSAEIAMRANRIADRAREDAAAWTRAETAHPDLRGEAEAGRKRADADIADAFGVTTALTGVEDQHPVMDTVVWVAGAAIAIAIAVILWQTGLGTAIRVAIGWLPRRKVQEADLAVAMLAEDKAEGPREFIAAKRASDPAFDAAYRKAKEKGKP